MRPVSRSRIGSSAGSRAGLLYELFITPALFQRVKWRIFREFHPPFRSEEHTSELQSPISPLFPYTTLFRSGSSAGSRAGLLYELFITPALFQRVKWRIFREFHPPF